MITKIFSIYDSKAAHYLNPFFAPNAAVALRMFERAVNEENTDFHRFAGDYTLFEIGEFRMDTGDVIPAPALINLGVGLTFVNPNGVR